MSTFLIKNLKIQHIVFLLMGILAGCSTEKNTYVNRAYHNTTSYYNGYFNAREIIRESSKTFEKNSPDDFSSVLDANKYPDESQAQSLFPEMERAIEKCSKVIAKHAMPSEKKGRDTKVEHCKWIDENWLLIGVGHFYKREYSEASEKLKYIIQQYPKLPTKYNAKLWLAKIEIENQNYYAAYQYLNDITTEKEAKELKETRQAKKEERLKNYSKKRDKLRKSSRGGIKRYNDDEDEDDGSLLVAFPKSLEGELEATYADYYIGKKDYAKAIESLEKAIELPGKRRKKIRYKYILAQLYQIQGDGTKASQLYKWVSRKAPYQMAFYAKMNKLLVDGNTGESKKQLKKLAKDSKYKEFRDQIYYALGNIEYNEGNKDKSLEYYIASTSQPNESNTKIKGEAYLKIANIYFDDRAYITAKSYYDSAISSLPKDYDDLDLLQIKAESLNDLTKYLENAHLQDSLLTLANLSEEDQVKYVTDYLYDLKEKQQKEKEEAQNNVVQQTQNNNINANEGKGKFWAFNPSAKSFGYNEFKTKWGNIPLEDNWRRQNKNSSSFNTTQIESTSTSLEVTDKEIEAYLANIPKNDDQKIVAENKMLGSLYEAGLIYKENLKDYGQAVNCFKKNVDRFLPDDKVLPSMFQLYKTYQLMGSDQSEVVKNQILSTFPNSDYAKIIRDPNYVNTLQEKSKTQAKEYESTYNMYTSKRYSQVIAKANTIENTNRFKCKYELLKAYSYSATAEFDSVKSVLNTIIKECQSDSVSIIAAKALNKKIELNTSENSENSSKSDDKKDSKDKSDEYDLSKSPYQYSPTSKHYFLVVIEEEGADINNIKNAIGDFNTTYFKSKSLRITPTFFDKKTQVLIIKNFNNRDYAQSYYQAFLSNDKELKDINSKYKFFSISDKNFITLYNSKVVDEYIAFFKAKYLSE